MSILISVGHQRGGARNDTDYIIVLIFNDWVLDYFMGYCCGAHPEFGVINIPSLGFVRRPTRCSATPSKVDFYPFYTLLAQSLYRFGTQKLRMGTSNELLIRISKARC